MTWLEQAQAQSLPAVAKQLGLTVRARGLTPCPACNHPGRGVRVFVQSRKERWYCHRCNQGGDVIDLVSFKLEGQRYSADVRETVRQWFDSGASIPAVAPVVELPEYPPASEVRALVGDCGHARADLEVAAWVESRVPGLDTSGLVGAYPNRVGSCPDWARYGLRSWVEHGYRAIFPLYDARGRLRSVRARCVRTPPKGAPKALPPRGYGCRGLVLANPAAVALLRTGARPENWKAGRLWQVMIVEGEPAWLAWADRDSPVFGIFSGAWTSEISGRIPHGTAVSVVVDNDSAGDRYWRKVSKTLDGRCLVSRR